MELQERQYRHAPFQLAFNWVWQATRRHTRSL